MHPQRIRGIIPKQHGDELEAYMENPIYPKNVLTRKPLRDIMQTPNIGRDKGKGDHMARIKSYEELTFSDDFMFCKVLENNKELCRELIELILDTKIRIIENVSRQKPIEITPDGRGIRLDVCMQGDDTVYNLEMQNTDKKDLQFRARYSQSMLDLDMMERGSEFRELTYS